MGEEAAEMIQISVAPRNGSTRRNQIFPVEITHASSFHINPPPLDSWLLITASRNGNAYYCAFQMLSSGIGVQALTLPVAFTVLGWAWGTIWLTVAFAWQFYTLWLLVQLHESMPGKRYDRYIQLSKAAFGEKLGFILGLFPTIYLSSGASTILVMTGGDMMRLLMKITSEQGTKSLPLTTIECNVIFVSVGVVIALFLPNLNSVSWISFIGASAAVSYCTLIWAISITKTRPNCISYDKVVQKSDIGSVLNVFNAVGIIALVFRGHNLILEIQATLPTSEVKPSLLTMWRSAKFAYLLIFLCYYPLAIAGYWEYGDKLVNQGGILNALHNYHRHNTSKSLVILTTTLVLIHCLCLYQIYAIPTLDNLTFYYTRYKKKQSSKMTQFMFRVSFGCLTLLVAVAIPFIRSLAGIMGGISLPLTFAFPCFMWIAIKKPQRWSAVWCANLILGISGIILGFLVFGGGIWTLIQPGIRVRFFKP